jgi:hypothetical protein
MPRDANGLTIAYFAFYTGGTADTELIWETTFISILAPCLQEVSDPLKTCVPEHRGLLREKKHFRPHPTPRLVQGVLSFNGICRAGVGAATIVKGVIN